MMNPTLTFKPFLKATPILMAAILSSLALSSAAPSAKMNDEARAKKRERQAKQVAKIQANPTYQAMIKTLTPLKGTTPAQWRVVWTDDARHEATISWSTAIHGKQHTVHVTTEPHGKDTAKYSMHIQSAKDGAYSINAKEAAESQLKTAFYHHAKLKGLKAGTKYYFIIESDGQFSKPLYFITSPDKLPFKLIHGGDSRTGLIERCKMNLLMTKLVKKDPKIMGLIHGGDYVISGQSWSNWRAWMSHNELLTLDDGRVIPIIPTLGNHDQGVLFYEIFNLKKNAHGTEADKTQVSSNSKKGKKGRNKTIRSYWQTTTLGGGVNIVTLDTNYSALGPQEKWLENQLSTLRPKSSWLIANYHRPLYPAVKTDPTHKKTFVPLFEKYNVDLALESDGHCIKRTVPIRNEQRDPTGVTYIGEGGLGVAQRQPKPDKWFLKGGLVGVGHHVMLLDFQKEHLEIKVILMDQSTKDTFQLKIRSK